MKQAQDWKSVEEFQKIKLELSKIQKRRAGIIAETFDKEHLEEVDYSEENLEALKRIHAYEVRKQDYFATWLKSQQEDHVKTEEEFRTGTHGEEEEEEEDGTSFFLILTVDLSGARPWALAKLEKALGVIGFEKFSSKPGDGQRRLRFPGFGTSANIYSAQVQVDDDLAIDMERDNINEKIRELMNQERDKGSMEEYRYILFVSKQWSWQEEGTS